MSAASSRTKAQRPSVQGPIEYEFVINLKTSKALGLTVWRELQNPAETAEFTP